MTYFIRFSPVYFRLLFMLAVGIATTVASVHQTVAQKIHLVIAADINANNGVGAIAKIDQDNIQHLFESNVPAAQLDITVVPAEEMKNTGILKAIDDLQVVNEDTIVFYYSGHGAFDRQTQQQYFQLNLGDLFRPELKNHITKKSPRLSVILTDCCNVQVDKVSNFQKRQSVAAVSLKEMSPLFKSLFIYRKGIVDITSSKLGEYSFCDNRKTNNRGSCFTYPLIDLMKANKDNAQMDWSQLVKQLGPKVNDAFKELYPNGHTSSGQMSQTIFIVEGIEDDPVKDTYRFGVRAAPNPNGSGMKMLEIMPNSPALRSGLEVGDIITEINGKPINTEQEYSDAVDASEKEMKVKLINTRDDKTITATITLGW